MPPSFPGQIDDNKVEEQKYVTVDVQNLVQQTLSKYPDEFARLRELIQNADDASANTVCIYLLCHRVSGECVDAEEMKVENNGREFTPADISDLTSIAGSTQEKDSTRVGRFGVGFFTAFKNCSMPRVASGHMRINFKGYEEHKLL
jgi:HSP90 family molecular chaperone